MPPNDPFWDKQEFIGEVPRDESQKIVVTRVELKGRSYIDIRTFYRLRSVGEWLPGKGIAIPEDYLKSVYRVLTLAVQSSNAQ